MSMRCSILFLWCLVLLVAGPLQGCSGPISPRPGSNKMYSAQLGQFARVPRARLGALPFPGPFTLYTEADPERLGHHSYSGRTPKGLGGEAERGIVYTRRAGFLDICHIRNAADMTAYVHARVRLALTQGWAQMRFVGKEPSVYTVGFTYPPWWQEMTAPERGALIDELSIRTAQRIALDVMTWHEIITWYGYKSTVLVPEKGSAFTYDDTPSHAVGVDLAGEALRAAGEYDDEMTRLLDERLQAYGVVSKEDQKHAIELVKHEWWSTLDGAKHRLIDVGEGDGLIEPWVITDLLTEDGEPAVLRIASLGDVVGHDMTGFYRVEIDPRILEGFVIRSKLADSPSRIVPRRDFPVLMADIARSLDEPLPGPGAAPRRFTSKKPAGDG